MENKDQDATLTDTGRLQYTPKKFAQLLHRFRGDIEFAQFLHKPDFCTKFAQDFSPVVATDCQIMLANKRYYLIIYG